MKRLIWFPPQWWIHQWDSFKKKFNRWAKDVSYFTLSVVLSVGALDVSTPQHHARISCILDNNFVLNFLFSRWMWKQTLLSEAQTSKWKSNRLNTFNFFSSLSFIFVNYLNITTQFKSFGQRRDILDKVYY